MGCRSASGTGSEGGGAWQGPSPTGTRQRKENETGGGLGQGGRRRGEETQEADGPRAAGWVQNPGQHGGETCHLLPDNQEPSSGTQQRWSAGYEQSKESVSHDRLAKMPGGLAQISRRLSSPALRLPLQHNKNKPRPLSCSPLTLRHSVQEAELLLWKIKPLPL